MKEAVVIELLGKDDKLRRALKRSRTSVQKLDRAFTQVSGGIGRIARSSVGLKTALVGAAAGVAAVVGTKAAIEAAIAQEEAINSVATALKRTGEFSVPALEQMEAFASKLQDLTGIGDETTLQMISVAQAYGANAETARDVVKASAELSAATGIELKQAVEQVSKTLGGMSGRLGLINPKIKELTKEQLLAGEAARVLIEQYDGTAASKLETFGGAVTNVKGRFGDMLEAFGELITKNPVVVGVIDEFAKGFTNLEIFIDKNADAIRSYVTDNLLALLKTISAVDKSFGVLFGTMDGFKAPSFTDFLDTTNLVIGNMTDNILALRQGVIKLQGVVERGINFFSDDPVDLSKFDDAIDQLETKREKLASSYGSLTEGVINAEGSEFAKAESAIDQLIAKIEGSSAELKVKPTLDTSGDSSSFADVPASGPVTKAKVLDFTTGVRNAASAFQPQFGPIKSASATEGSSKGGSVTHDTKTGNKELKKRLRSLATSIPAALSSGIAAGANGASGFVTQATTQVADALLPGLGATVGPIVGLLGQGAEKTKEAVVSFTDALPDVLVALFESAPVFIEALIDALPELIEAIIRNLPRIGMAIVHTIVRGLSSAFISIGELIRTSFKLTLEGFNDLLSGSFSSLADAGNAMVKSVRDGLTNFFSTIGKTVADIVGDIVKGISAPFIKLRDFIEDIIKKLTPGRNAAIGGSGKGGFERAIGFDIPGLKFAKGGMVRGFGNRDSIPAALTPGELVVDRTTGPRLNEFLDSYKEAKRSSGTPALTDALLTKILNELQKPNEVRTTVKVREKALADIMLNLSRTNARTAA